MDIVQYIRNEHMKTRCYFISLMCSMSLYTWYNYSLYDPIVNNYFTIYYQNSLFFMFYLVWDIYYMTLSNHKMYLYRNDLVIHHIISFIIYLNCINKISLLMSNVLIMELISLMNYCWKDNPIKLNVYRIMCILLIRMPLSFWLWLYYNPILIFHFFKITKTHPQYMYALTLGNTPVFFICYDIYILWKIYKLKPKFFKASNRISN